MSVYTHIHTCIIYYTVFESLRKLYYVLLCIIRCDQFPQMSIIINIMNFIHHILSIYILLLLSLIPCLFLCLFPFFYNMTFLSEYYYSECIFIFSGIHTYKRLDLLVKYRGNNSHEKIS